MNDGKEVKDLELLKKDRYITEIINDFDFQHYIKERYRRNENKEKVENIYDIDFSCF